MIILNSDFKTINRSLLIYGNRLFAGHLFWCDKLHAWEQLNKTGLVSLISSKSNTATTTTTTTTTSTTPSTTTKHNNIDNINNNNNNKNHQQQQQKQKHRDSNSNNNNKSTATSTTKRNSRVWRPFRIVCNTIHTCSLFCNLRCLTFF